MVGSDEVFYSRDTGIDWDVIFLLFGMMVIVSVLRQTGVFEYIAIWAAKRANGSLVKTGVVDQVARAATKADWRNALLTVMLILGVSTPVSGLIDNIPYVATMAPIVSELAAGCRIRLTRRPCGGRLHSARTSVGT